MVRMRIQSKRREMRTRKTPNTNNFHSVLISTSLRETTRIKIQALFYLWQV